MTTIIFIVIVLGSGALAGLAYGFVNLVIVEPYLDEAIMIESQEIFAAGQSGDAQRFWAEHDAYRDWQKGGQVLSAVVLGVSFGAIFGIVYALSRGALPARSEIGKALMLAGIMWFTIYLVPFLKYPASLPGDGDGQTVVLRTLMYLALVAISCASAAGCYKLSTLLRGRQKLIALAVYAALISAAFTMMPDSPDGQPEQGALSDGFRAASLIGVSVFWAMQGLVLGALWRRYRPHDRVVRQR